MAAEGDSGHFRITFQGYQACYVSGSTRPDAERGEPFAAWDAPADEDERAYFQAEISWINLGGGAPQSAALTAMITGDVSGLRAPSGPGANRAPDAPLPLSLGTYALIAGKNAVAIGNPAVQAAVPSRADVSPAPGRKASASRRAEGRTAAPPSVRAGEACRLDAPLSRPQRGRVLFLDYQTAQRLARTDHGFGRGIFPMLYEDPGEPGREFELFFGIERLA